MDVSIFETMRVILSEAKNPEDTGDILTADIVWILHSTALVQSDSKSGSKS